MNNLDKWFDKPLGHAVIESVNRQWDIFGLSNSLLFGDSLQIGTSTSILPLKKTIIVANELFAGTNVVASTSALPFNSESFSLAFLPFALEKTKDLHGFLDEITRVLTPDGFVCIVGINPFSLWGAAQLVHSKPTKLFTEARYSSLRVYAALAARDYNILGIKSFFYRLPFSSAKLLRKFRFLEPVGQMFWPYPGGLYFLMAQKVTPQFLSVRPLLKTGGYVFGKA